MKLAILLLLALQGPRDAATALYKEKKFAEAARALGEHLATHPEDFPARLLMGLCYQQSGDNGRAEAVLQEAARLRPENAAARFYLARVDYLLKKFREAEQEARLSIKLRGDAGRAYNLIGLILAEQNRNEEALRAYEAARGVAEADLNAAVLLLKLGRAREAVERLEQAQSEEALYHRARAYLELGRLAEAARDLVEARDFEPARRLREQVRAGVGAGRGAGRGAGAPPHIQFREVADKAGVRFVLENHATADKNLIETMAGGVATFDYNGDGRADIYFTNGAAIPSLEKETPKYFNRLYRNDGGMRFTDVTAEAGVAGAGYSIGVAAGDYDNDGNVDLFVAGVNRNLLYRNRGNGKFEDVAAKAGIRSGLWSVGAGWFDYDNDGRLDLFVVNYLRWSDRYCADPAGRVRVYCHPQHFAGLPNTLYRNRGDGTFEDVSDKAGIRGHTGKGMSVAFADYDEDGFVDAFVANDTLPNFLFHNRGNGTFEEVALQAGAALTDDGKAVSGMGSDFRDYDNDGRPDLSVTALVGETFPLFRNQGKGFFRDATYPSRIGLASVQRSGWSNGFVDLNNDGWKDLFSANAHVMDNVDLLGPHHYRQTNSVFVNLGNGTFADVPEAGFSTRRAHRGAAFADFNGDGKLDVVVTALGEPAELWENISPGPNHWIVLQLEGTKSNRDGIGARVRLGDQWNQMTTSVGYASSSHYGVHFGVGKSETGEKIEVRWPSGVTQVLEGARVGQVVKVRER